MNTLNKLQLLLAVIAVLGFSVNLNAEVTESLPKGTTITKIDVFPKKIDLDGPYAYRQVLLTAQLNDGRVADVTRVARAEHDGKHLKVTPEGKVIAYADGKGVLHFVLAKQKVSIPFEVKNSKKKLRPDFIRDVQPILTKVGCNQGTCHGSLNGKNGFKLSLRGNDYLFDHRSITDDHSGRRFNRAAPDRSLFLMKTTGLSPHVGGTLLTPGEPYYEILKDWVEDGVPINPDASRVTKIEIHPESRVMPLPNMTQQFAVIAHYSDGTVKDVTSESFIETNNTEITAVQEGGKVTALRRGEAAILARYEGNYAATQFFVMGDRTGFTWKETETFNKIDELVYAKLKKFKIEPAEVCSDSEFLRRIYLDLTGLPPTLKQTKVFLADKRDSRQKRSELIDRLIGSAEFVEHWTNKWADLLQVNRKFLGTAGAKKFREWISGSIASNKPYNQFSYELLSATGSSLKNPPAAYYRAVKEPDIVMENTTQLFLGVRFNCNKCHDHPFERWTQSQHWELAAFFARVGRRGGPGGKSEEIIFDKKDGEIKAPYNNQVVQPLFPYKHSASIPSEASRREKLARWMTARENEYFTKSYVNRIWSYFLGLGIIDPVDDLRASNPATNPELLAYLENDFVENGFDVRRLMKLITSSRTYQHSIKSNKWNEDDEVNFSHASARRLSAETLYDSVHLVTGSTTSFAGQRKGTRAAELPGPEIKTKDGFLDLFGRPPRESVCECERTTGMSLGQALNLVNGSTVSDAINNPENDISNLLLIEKNPANIVEELFLRILNRYPSQKEQQEMISALDARKLENAESLQEADFKSLMDQVRAHANNLKRRIWSPLKAGSGFSAGGATVDARPDGSYFISGAKPDKDTYTLVTFTNLKDITGLRLEVLTDPAIGKSKGPGRSDGGNFVLTNLKMMVAPVGDPAKAVPVKFKRAEASVNQKNYEVGRSIDADLKTGWAINKGGDRRLAIFEVAEKFGFTGGTIITLTLDQQHGGFHTIGKMRLSVNQSAGQLTVAELPKAIEDALKVEEAKRTPAQKNVIFGDFMKNQQVIADKIRLAVSQDIAWALLNSPAFLFNH